MARIYARKHGKARSTRPQIPAGWVEYSGDEVEKLVLKLAKDGLQPAQIGLVLRDQYGIPLVKSATGKTILQILSENNIAPKIPSDLFNLLKKSVMLHTHISKNKKDAHAIHGVELLESKIRRLAKYYVAVGKMPEGWRYDAEAAKLIVEKGEL